MDDREVWLVGGVLLAGERVLLCRRGAERASYPDLWDLPGGHVEAGEDDTAALRRECREELGIEVLDSVSVAMVEPSTDVSLSVRLIREWRGAPINAAPEEHSEIAWFSADELAGLPLADDRYLPLLTELMRPAQRVEIRRIDEPAWRLIGALHALSRQETYAPLLPLGPGPLFRPADLDEHWRSRTDLASLVLHGGWDDTTLLGFVATVPVTARRFELTSMHVRPDWHGRGLAAWLHRAALASVSSQGGRELRLWVLADNARAQRFYQKHGWRAVDDHRQVPLAGTTLPAVAYAREL
jgi:mutator protein MutT